MNYYWNRANSETVRPQYAAENGENEDNGEKLSSSSFAVRARNFRAGACANCGALGHVPKSCFHKPMTLKNMAKFSNLQYQEDDDVVARRSITVPMDASSDAARSQSQEIIIAAVKTINNGNGVVVDALFKFLEENYHLPPHYRKYFEDDLTELVCQNKLEKVETREAKEFVPSSYKKNNQSLSPDDFVIAKKQSDEELNGDNKKDALNRRRRDSYNQGRRGRLPGRASKAQSEDGIRRTVYVSDIDQTVTEEVLAGFFSSYGQVVDCRICGDPHSVLRFAFVEFSDDQGARAALSVGGTVIGSYPVRVLPSKTAIRPVNPTFLPMSEDEREMCTRTIYCTIVDKNATEDDVKTFFESTCGEVTRIRLLGDQLHSTRTAFVEFAMAESAVAALNCSGMVLGSQPIKVKPFKDTSEITIHSITLDKLFEKVETQQQATNPTAPLNPEDTTEAESNSETEV